VALPLQVPLLVWRQLAQLPLLPLAPLRPGWLVPRH
jgi:hypothetical protein